MQANDAVAASGGSGAEQAVARDAPEHQVQVLTRGVLEPEGRLVDASNTTLRCWATLDGVSVRCVYKPVAGERPLWDFPDGTLAGREVAAYLVAAYLGSVASGWELVPPTVHRDGPLGSGACQLWIEESAEPSSTSPVPQLVGFVPADALPDGWYQIAAAEDPDGRPYLLAHADDPRLARMAIFDMVVNNADRKGGHVLVGDGRVYGVDHGVCFHVEPKLRTVLWGWSGAPLPEEAAPVLAALVAALEGQLGETLATHLSRAEVAAMSRRADHLRRSGRFTAPGRHGPAVPWPPI